MAFRVTFLNADLEPSVAMSLYVLVGQSRQHRLLHEPDGSNSMLAICENYDDSRSSVPVVRGVVRSAQTRVKLSKDLLS